MQIIDKIKILKDNFSKKFLEKISLRMHEK